MNGGDVEAVNGRQRFSVLCWSDKKRMDDRPSRLTYVHTKVKKRGFNNAVFRLILFSSVYRVWGDKKELAALYKPRIMMKIYVVHFQVSRQVVFNIDRRNMLYTTVTILTYHYLIMVRQFRC